MKKKVLFIIISLLTIGIGSHIYARYVLNKNINVNITTSPFYFEADINQTELDLNEDNVQLDLTIKNNDGNNYNLYDANYEICLLDNSKFNMTLEDSNNGIIHGNTSKDNTITIELTPVESAVLKAKETLTISIKSTKPFTKQINKTVTINVPYSELIFGSLDDFKQITEEECLEYASQWGDYFELYGGNNEQLEYDSDGALVFDEDNPILYLEVEDGNELFSNEYSLYFTINADVMQGEDFGGTIASIGNGNRNYLTWISLYKGYLHIYSYYLGYAKSNIEKEIVEPGFLSYDITKYSNTTFNIQITATKTGKTNVYINGQALTSFESGGEDIETTHVTIGDLRPLRCLKFNGKIYDFAMYDKVLTEEEIQLNWKHAKNEWID